jgi:hypothetical protein
LVAWQITAFVIIIATGFPTSAAEVSALILCFLQKALNELDEVKKKLSSLESKLEQKSTTSAYLEDQLGD